jgi:TRAP-type mannitol/chloroaromatic compound transport system permease small subunit
VDIVYQSRRVMNDRRRAWVNLLGTLLFLYPFAVLIIVSSWPFVRNAFMIGEGSPDPGGLPYRYLLKAAIPVCFALLVLQGLSMIIRNVLFLRERGGQKP